MQIEILYAFATLQTRSIGNRTTNQYHSASEVWGLQDRLVSKQIALQCSPKKVLFFLYLLDRATSW